MKLKFFIAIVLVLFFTTSEPTFGQQPKKLIISTDNAAGAKLFNFFASEPDDSLALAVLLEAHKKGELEIMAITSTFGNTSGEESYQITKKQIELSGLTIPIVRGAVKAGQTDSEAARYIADTLRKSKEKIILVGLGPVTDLAAVFSKYPELKEKVEYFFLVRSGPYLIKKYWYLFSFNSLWDIKSAQFMHKLGANQFSMGEEIFKITFDNRQVKELQDINNPMTRYITKDLLQWNRQNKILPNKGYFLRKGNLCPWDLVWSMYLVEPNLFNIRKENNTYILSIKNSNEFIQKTINSIKQL